MTEYTYIYELIDPITRKPRYVGKANNPKRRLSEHITRRNEHSRPVNLWVRELVKNELRPKMRIVMKVPFSCWKKLERSLIRHYRSIGVDLLNVHKGGGGGVGIEWSDEMKKEMSDLKTQQWSDPEKRERYIQAIRESHQTDEFRSIVSENSKDNWKDDDFRERVTNAVIEHHSNPDFREQCRQKTLEIMTDEMKELIGQKSSEYWSVKDHVEVASNRTIELWNDDEYREKTIEGIRRGHRTKEAREKFSKISSERWEDEDYRKRVSDGVREHHKDPDFRRGQSEKMRELWQNPEYREKQLAAIRKRRSRK